MVLTIKPEKREMKERTAYLVNTSRCQIVRWPTFDEQVVPLYRNKSNERIHCKTDDHFRDVTIERYNFTGVRVVNKSGKPMNCSYSIVSRRSGTDDYVHYSRGHGLVAITCVLGKEKYVKAIPLIPDLSIKAHNESQNLPNILFVGLDSISRLNFDRHFPKTIQFLDRHDFYTMYGYNKVADNTYPNLTPLLTGYYIDDLWNETMSKKDYHNRGYNTLLVEDWPQVAAFNFLKKGFSEPPTDYYLRPYSLAIEKKLKNNCYYDRTEIETYYDYIYDFVTAMRRRNQKYFAFTFMARLTHMVDLSRPDRLDGHVVNELFEKLRLDDRLCYEYKKSLVP
ncbi:unnamed protein product [Oppiella nova]|uniref:Uncharacterized protein n=1 Tax=Oppiella nova TaxID=334625 RepID=A0A7R9LRW2_9ACAR|nr:unnamed protein product [Oppiella nova]CAG2166375.1 unnamed protein product [Oppiella nova]